MTDDTKSFPLRLALRLLPGLDSLVLEVAVIPVNDLGRDLIEAVPVRGVVRGFLLQDEFLRLAGFLIQAERLVLRSHRVVLGGNEQDRARRDSRDVILRAELEQSVRRAQRNAVGNKVLHIFFYGSLLALRG